MKLIFRLQINTTIFCKLIASLWVCLARHTQSTQNNKFGILQYLKQNVKDEIGFLFPDKHQRFLQIDIVNLGMCVFVARHVQITQNNKLLFLCNISRKKRVMKLIFYMEVSEKLILWFWWGQSSIPKIPKIASLQCHLKKEVRDKVDFLHADKHQSFLLVDVNTVGIKLILLLLLLGMMKHSQST